MNIFWWKWFVVIRYIGSGSDMLKAIVTSLQDEANLITDTLSLGGTKFMGVCRMPDDKSKIVHSNHLFLSESEYKKKYG